MDKSGVRSIWAKRELKLMMAMYRENQISEEMTANEFWAFFVQTLKKLSNRERTIRECIKKFQQMEKIYRKVLRANNKSGASPKTCFLFEVLER